VLHRNVRLRRSSLPNNQRSRASATDAIITAFAAVIRLKDHKWVHASIRRQAIQEGIDTTQPAGGDGYPSVTPEELHAAGRIIFAFLLVKWWRGTESNCRHYDFQSTNGGIS
jgi:hypothetical protein